MKNIVFILCMIIATNMVAQDRSIRPQAAPAPEIQLGSTASFVMENKHTV